MITRATAANPDLLRWARLRAGLSLGEAAERIGKSAKDLEAWESGGAAPTYIQLETLAERVYRRPVALFFLPEPPEEEPLESEFRTLPDAEIDALDADTRFALREARVFMDSVRELSAGLNPADRQIWRAIRGRPGQDMSLLAVEIREYLGVDLETQFSWPNAREAMRSWRDAVEQAGVFVFKRSFKQDDVSGFCLHDPDFPVIVINNSTAFSRQIFTLFHELAHILFDVSGVTKVDSSFIDRMTGSAGRIEAACNRIAAEILVPAAAFPWAEFRGNDLSEPVAQIAQRFRVSKHVVLRRLLDAGRVDQGTYRTMTREWDEEFQGRGAESGGNYYATQTSYLGRTFLDLAFSQFYAGKVSLPELADHLGIKARNVGKLEDFILAQK